MWVQLFIFSWVIIPTWASVVSLDLGADQWVLGLAPKTAIHSLSYLAHDKQISYLASQATNIRFHSGSLDYFLDPTIKTVIGYEPISIPLKKLCQRRGIYLIELSYPRSFAELKEQIIMLTTFFHQSEQGKKWIHHLTSLEGNKPRCTAAFYSAHGLAPGGHTLLNDVLTAGGYDNLYKNKKGWTYNSLESLLTSPLCSLFFLDAAPQSPSPLWNHLKKKMKLKQISQRLTLCPYPPAVFDLINSLRGYNA